VLAEMYRVCKPEGTIVIADVIMPQEIVAAYNRLEKLRDNSHSSVLSFVQMENMLQETGLKNLRRSSYLVEMDIETQLAASFPKEGDLEKIRDIFRNDLSENRLGLNTRLRGKEIHVSYPITIYAGTK
jgi:ubiquinone/menaquinone biosynthesis C-methylase UbiE